jgi:hypothetical protein
MCEIDETGSRAAIDLPARDVAEKGFDPFSRTSLAARRITEEDLRLLQEEPKPLTILFPVAIDG